jgi:hypothetical protein
MGLINIKVFDDPTPSGIINLRYVTNFVSIADTYTNLSAEEFQPFLRSLLFVGKKLVATWTHLDRYIRLENDLIEKANVEQPLETKQIQHISYAQDLFIELDEFLVQLKSVLDYLAKLPRNIIGKSNWPDLRTFGDKGKAVENALKNNIPSKWSNHAQLNLKLLDQYRPWLHMAVTARDKINHGKDGGIDFEAFVIAKTNRNGKEEIIVPIWAEDITAREYMTVCWSNLLQFSEQFTMGFVAMRLKEGMGFVHVPKKPDSVDSPIVVAPHDALPNIIEVMNVLQQNEKAKRS